MTRRMAAIGIAVMAVLGGAATVGNSQPEAKVDSKAKEHLKAMSNYLANLRTFTFQVEEFIDVVQDEGLKLQLSNQRHMAVSRPNKLFGESTGDTVNSQIYYNGKTVTIYERNKKIYAVEKVPGTIDAMLDDLHDRIETDQPLSDFLFSDPYKMFMEHVRSGAYVGLHYVGKEKCHHLAFRQKTLDWQIWIDAGEKPLPRKLLITFRRQVDQPQYAALIHKWDVNPTLKDDMFEFKAPEGVRKVDFLHRFAEPKAVKKP